MNMTLTRSSSARGYVKAAVAAVIAVATASAQAALDAAVATELATAKADVLTIGALVFAIAVGIVLYKWFKRAL